ncbi:hypothetical protein [Aminobacter sp. AP02]|uniref:hypothetical protein n=1 Tax=Aminobacter sp. AP02 TaxID=2135737 RepID=UPI000D6D9C9C|nr:hypothetical protein [Aminobacter sp. AP02]PWK61248.1 hypothetical protein C8K44_1342 [Aminobacter sp. AP02]
MADSDHNMTLPCVTRRVAFVSTILALAGWPFQARALAYGAVPKDTATDPAVLLWQNFKAVQLKGELLYRRMQELEIELAERVDFLGTVVSIPGGGDVLVCSKEGLDRIVGDRADMADLRAKAESELNAGQAQFDAAASEIGYFTALKAEQEAFAQVSFLLDALSTTPAVSVAGVAGKLDAVMCEGEARDDCLAFPWPQIRAARDDLLRIGPKMPNGESFREFGRHC